MMSRHRNVRQYTYSDDFDDVEDEDFFGRSVEEHYSSDEASFIYDRSKNQTNISSFLDRTQNDSQVNGAKDHMEIEISPPEVQDVFKEAVQAASRVQITITTPVDNVVEGFSIPKNEVKSEYSTNRYSKIVCHSPEAAFSDLNNPDIKKGLKNIPKVNLESSSPDITRKENEEVNNVPARIKSISKTETVPFSSRQEFGKQHLQMIVIGHVDAGKSTLMGHLLYKLGCVQQKVIQKYEHEAKKIGKQSFAFAWVLDEVEEERGHGITIDIGKSKFETSNRTVTLLDAPGHKDFIPNMMIGANQADVALLVIDATLGEFETGFESGGQTREHTLLVRSLGVNQLAVVVNKMDNVSWSEERFNEISTKLNVFLKQAGFKENDVYYVPCSGLCGENLSEKPKTSAAHWYTGATLIEVIDTFKPPERSFNKPFRMCVNDIYKGVGSAASIAGQVETGYVGIGNKVLVQPLGEVAVVKGLLVDDKNEQTIFAGTYANVVLNNVDLDSINIGNVICDVDSPIPVTTNFEARIVIFNIIVPITVGYTFVLHQLSFNDSVVIKKLKAEVHRVTGELVKKRPRCLLKNTAAIVTIETSRPVCIELYKDVKEFGRFTLRDAGVTIAAGLVTKILN